MNNNQLGKIIKNIRSSKKITQSKLGELTGFSQNTISNHENGNRAVGESEVSKYAKALNVSTKYIYNQLDELNNDESTVIQKQFGKIVAEKISTLNIDIETIVEKTNLSQKSINGIVSGYIDNVSVNKLHQLCIVLNISPNYIFSDENTEETYEEYVKTKEMYNFITANFSKLPFKTKESVYNYFLYEFNNNNEGDSSDS
ncbi:helix-turn-helix domain-containing protein [Staphylococcus equorum]|uniref:helix-turn-helix domain-containing protein n=1 Tax=Staphylococcus equorum TaxID=246432 RepID=UPI0029823664|nr:helix-turn-helix transcriptional regulator [Staphylococcus equorum]MDW5472305.1 helix-turn-helix transcriptional regulator [Staphylococcus equorum]